MTTGSVTTPLGATNTESFVFQASSKGNQYAPTTRIDYNVNDNHRLTGTYWWQRFLAIPDLLNNAESVFPGFPVEGHQTSYRTTGSVGLRSTLSWGIDALGATTAGSSAIADGRFVAWLGQAQWVHRLPESLVVTPPAATPIQLPVNGVRTLGVVAEAADRTAIPEARVAWEVGDTMLVAFDQAKGTVVGKTQGRTTITARVHGFEPVVWTVEVIPGIVGLDRTRLGLALGARDTLHAVLLDDSGQPIGPAPELEWRSERPDVVRASAGGVIDALRPGRVRVTATDRLGVPPNTRSDSSDTPVSIARGGTTTLTWDDVKPIFVTYCVECHGQPARTVSLEAFRLDKYDASDPEPPANGDPGVFEMKGAVYQRAIVILTAPLSESGSQYWTEPFPKDVSPTRGARS